MAKFKAKTLKGQQSEFLRWYTRHYRTTRAHAVEETKVKNILKLIELRYNDANNIGITKTM